MKLDQLVIALRDSTGKNVDFPGLAQNYNVSPTGSTYTSQAKQLPAGRYTMFVAYSYGGSWQDLPPQNLDIWTVNGKRSVFPANFTETGQFATSQWFAGRTGAYPAMAGSTSQLNTTDHKRDCIDSAWSAPRADGTFEADKVTTGCGTTPGTFWRSDLVTTRDPSDLSKGFKMQPGDSVTATVTVTDEAGSWPGIWTWSDNGTTSPDYIDQGHGEVDAMEHHGSVPTTLELSNPTARAVGSDSVHCPQNPGMITPNQPFGLQMDVTTSGVTFWINGTAVCSLPGVPADWRAHLIVNLSIDDGHDANHSLPNKAHLASFKVRDLTVWR